MVNGFHAHNLNLEVYKIKSTLAYKIFSTLHLILSWLVWEEIKRMVHFASCVNGP